MVQSQQRAKTDNVGKENVECYRHNFLRTDNYSLEQDVKSPEMTTSTL